MSEAVNSAVAEAKKQGGDTTAVVEIKVKAPANSNSVETSIPKDAVGLVTNGGADALKVSTPVASISFDTDALDTIYDEAAGDVKITMAKVDASSLGPDTNPTDNFSDAGNTYYTGYLAAAKRLGITEGLGNNLYAPNKQITRQEMFALLYNTLKVIGQLPEGAGKAGGALMGYSDADSVASWAKDAAGTLTDAGIIGGNNGKLSPKNTTTRAEMAQVLYNLITR